MSDKEKEIRKKANDALLAKMARGESLTTVPTSMTWFPPRPIIEKDLSGLYGEKKDKPKSQTNLFYLKGRDDEDK